MCKATRAVTHAVLYTVHDTRFYLSHVRTVRVQYLLYVEACLLYTVCCVAVYDTRYDTHTAHSKILVYKIRLNNQPLFFLP